MQLGRVQLDPKNNFLNALHINNWFLCIFFGWIDISCFNLNQWHDIIYLLATKGQGRAGFQVRD